MIAVRILMLLLASYFVFVFFDITWMFFFCYTVSLKDRVWCVCNFKRKIDIHLKFVFVDVKRTINK